MGSRRPLFAVAMAAALSFSGCRREAPPVLTSIPPFALTDQAGNAFGSDQLRGQVWIANFVFTRCPTVCPIFTAEMGKVQGRLENREANVRLVSFSVDPLYDTPERLTEYGTRHGADFDRWSFLTGEPEAIKEAVVKGLKVAAEPVGPDDDLASVFHGTHFVLVDHDLRIRGYYDSSDPARIKAMLRDAATIAR